MNECSKIHFLGWSIKKVFTQPPLEGAGGGLISLSPNPVMLAKAGIPHPIDAFVFQGIAGQARNDRVLFFVAAPSHPPSSPSLLEAV
jgi:hypothetical protein